MPADCLLLNLNISGNICAVETAEFKRHHQFCTKHAGSNNMVSSKYTELVSSDFSTNEADISIDMTGTWLFFL